MRQSEAYWLRSLLSVYIYSPPVRGHTEGSYTHPNTHKHTHAKTAYAALIISKLKWKSRLQTAMALESKGCACVHNSCVFALVKWSLNLARRLFGRHVNSDYLSCSVTSECCSDAYQAGKCWTFHLCCVLAPCQQTLLELFSNRDLSRMFARCGNGGHHLDYLSWISDC